MKIINYQISIQINIPIIHIKTRIVNCAHSIPSGSNTNQNLVVIVECESDENNTELVIFFAFNFEIINNGSDLKFSSSIKLMSIKKSSLLNYDHDCELSTNLLKYCQIVLVSDEPGLACYVAFALKDGPVKIIAINFASNPMQIDQGGDELTCGEEFSRRFIFELPLEICPLIIGTGLAWGGDEALIYTSRGCVVGMKAKFEKSKPIEEESGGEDEVEQLTLLLRKAFDSSVHEHDVSAESIQRSLKGRLSSCSHRNLDLAIVGVSSQLVDADAPTSQTSHSALLGKLKTHDAFVSFLTHAGLYKRTSTSRSILSEDGEMIAGCLALFENRNDVVARDSSSESSEVFGEVLRGLQNTCSHIVSRLEILQQRIVERNSDKLVLLRDANTAICIAFGAALTRREERAEVYDCNDISSDPWTSTFQVRELLVKQLQLIGQMTDTASKVVVVHVQSLVGILLGGYKNATDYSKDESLWKSGYEIAKSVSVQLLRTFVDDRSALNVAIGHCYFLGITEICETNSWRDKLESLMKEKAENGGLQGVKSSGGNSIEFCKFVLEWYYERNLNAELLDVGTFSPVTLASFLEGKSELKWMNDLRDQRFGDSSNCLLKIGNGKSNLEERKLWLSLAKISGLAAGDNSEAAIRATDGLVSVYGQEMIGNLGDNALDFIHLGLAASSKLKSTSEDERIRNIMVGLSTSEIVMKSDAEKGEFIAKVMWAAVVDCEREMWSKLSQQREGFGDGELEGLLRDTLLWTAMKTYGDGSSVFELKGVRLDSVIKEIKEKGEKEGGGSKIDDGLIRICVALDEVEDREEDNNNDNNHMQM